MALNDRDRALYESMVKSQKSMAESFSEMVKLMAHLVKKEDSKTKEDLLPELIAAIKNIKIESTVNNVLPESTPVKVTAKKATAKK